MKEIEFYQTREGKEPFKEWLENLRDSILEHAILTRLHRIRQGNYGDHKRFYGIIEVRLHLGMGYRIYCGEEGEKLVILLTGGDKSSQDHDIKQAEKYWRDYNEQKKI